MMMSSPTFTICVVFSLVAISSCVIPGEILSDLSEWKSNDTCLKPECLYAATRILKPMNQRVKPCDDFYEFACGNYAGSVPIPDDRAMVDEQIESRIKVQWLLQQIIENIDETTALKPFRLIKILYNNCMKSDTPKMNISDDKSWKRYVRKISDCPLFSEDKWDQKAFRKRDMLKNIFSANYEKDLNNSNRYILGLSVKSPLIAPQYLRADVKNKIISGYMQYMIDIAVFLGANEEDAAHYQLTTLNLERDLFSYVFQERDEHERYLQYTRINYEELAKKFPKLGFEKFLERHDNPVIQMDVNLETLGRLQEIYTKYDKKAWANWSKWKYITNHVRKFNGYLADRTSAFHDTLYGRRAETAKWRRCVSNVRETFPFSLGALYQRAYMNQAVVDNLITMLENVKEEFAVLVEKADWLEKSTKEHALEKVRKLSSSLATCRELIRDDELEEYYEILHLSGDSYEANKQNISDFNKIVKAFTFYGVSNLIDKSDCGRILSSDDVYESGKNRLYFVAEMFANIMNAGNPTKYLAYGAVGSLMGHQISYTVDETGRYFRENGTLNLWWDSDSIQKYNESAQCFVNQYGNYLNYETDQHHGGLPTYKENVADNVGVKAAYFAYLQRVETSKPEKQLPALDYTPRQMFWISMANSFCSNYRPEYVENRIMVDNRSLNKLRVNGPVSNMPEFATDFKCDSGAPMNPVEKCLIW